MTPCAGLTHLFFPTDDETPTTRRRRVPKAIAICHTCPTCQRCLNDALDRGEPCGVWGGVNLDPQHGGCRPGAGGRTPGQPRQPIRHGTPGGASTHRRRGEEPCDLCRDAHNNSERARRETQSTPIKGIR